MNIVITGVRKGLGKALFEALSRKGHQVLGMSRGINSSSSKNLTMLKLDVTSHNAELKLKKWISKHWSCIDVLINNAGRGSFGSKISEIDLVEIKNQLMLHCVGGLRMTKAAYPFLLKSKSPLVINITSRLGSVYNNLKGKFRNRQFSYGYRIAKAAQNMLTLCMSQDKSMGKIKVIAVNPGLLRTDSGSKDANHSAGEAAEMLVNLIGKRVVNGKMYHLFGEKTNW